MKHLCIWLVRLYQKYLSPLKGRPTCRFTPTCSAYAIQAFQKRGFFVGMLLTAMRIFRCQPFCAPGYDPVPEKGLRYKGPRVIPITSDEVCCEHHSEPCREDDGKGHQEELDGEKEASYRENGEA